MKEQQDSLFSNDQRMMNLFRTLDKKLQNKIIRFEKSRATCKELKASAISLEKTPASIETLSQKANPFLRQNCKPQSQRSNAISGQKQKSKEGKQAGPKESKDSERKKP